MSILAIATIIVLALGAIVHLVLAAIKIGEMIHRGDE